MFQSIRLLLDRNFVGETQVREVLFLVATCLMSLFLGLYKLGDKSLWGDELNNIWFMTGERELWMSSGNGLGFLPILRLMGLLGGTDSLYRLPAVVAGVICLPLLYFVAKELDVDRLTASIAVICLTVSLSLLVLLLFLYGWNHHSRLAWSACAVMAAVGFNFHLYMVFVILNIIVIHMIFLVRSGNWRSLHTVFERSSRWWLASTVLICGIVLWPLFADWVMPLGLDLVRKLSGGTPEVVRFSRSPKFTFEWALFERLVHQMFVWKQPFEGTVRVTSALCFIGAIVMAIRTWKGRVVIFVWVLLPILPIALFAYSSNLDFGTRRFLFVLPLLMICVAYGLRWLSGLPGVMLRRTRARGLEPAMTVVLAAAYVVSLAWPTVRYFYDRKEYSDYKRAAILLERCGRPGDVVFTYRPERFLYYYRGEIGISTIGRSMLDELEEAVNWGQRIWYFRGARVNRWDDYRPVGRWFEKQGAFLFTLGGELKVSVIPSAEAGSVAHHEEEARVIETAVEIHPDRPYLRYRLAEAYERLGRSQESRQQLEIAATLSR